ncbi:MAG: Phage head-tail joining protein [Betaproteobacteria bacterium ADurb.Bin341]|jgi:SPP1 family predicted phage head-tail adaptor|nr:MAG: Phage head-tail joining protein [Betaproteobacteria bacterium ADurb.Bin341]HXK43278.1 phage head closure protein [Anaerolineae bacterium]
MRAGRLNRRISIRKSTSSPDSYGGQIPTWSTFLNDAWAQVRPLSMREMWQADQVSSPIDTEFLLRYATGITPSMIVVYDGKEYNIHSVIDVGDKHTELRILASRRST